MSLTDNHWRSPPRARRIGMVRENQATESNDMPNWDEFNWDEGFWDDGPGPVIPPPIKKGKHMDYVPKKRNARYLWLKKNHDNLDTEGPKISMTSGEITTAKGILAPIITAIEETDAADTIAASKRGIERLTEKNGLAAYRALVRNWKTRPSYPMSGVDDTLELSGSEVEFDPSTYKPVIKVTIEAGKIRVDFVKDGADGVAVYCRLRGTPGWTRIGTDTDAPYFDTKPLANSAVPEVREYMARGMVGDEEIGLDSDVVSIVFAG